MIDSIMALTVKTSIPRIGWSGKLYPRRFKGRCQSDHMMPVATAAAKGLSARSRSWR